MARGKWVCGRSLVTQEIKAERNNGWFTLYITSWNSGGGSKELLKQLVQGLKGLTAPIGGVKTGEKRQKLECPHPAGPYAILVFYPIVFYHASLY
jgi:hypothetical protein